MTELSEDQIGTIFLRWYKGEKVDSLFKELGIQKTAGKAFSKHFPPISCEIFCPYCSEELYAFRSDSTHYKKSQSAYDITTAHCLNCGHDTKKANCRCEGCELEKLKEKLTQAEKEAERLKQRAIQLERLYDTIVPIDFEKSDLIELIYLYALCYQSTCEDVTLISPPSTAESPLSPIDHWDRDIIQTLLNYIAPFCDDERLLQIDENGSASWSGQQVFYRIKIKAVDETDFLQTLLDHIKNRLQKLSLEDEFRLITLFEKLMISECIAYLDYMRNDFDLPHEVGPKTVALFKTLIQNWRIDQIYSIIWGRCKDALAYKVQNGLPKQHASNLVIGMISKYVDKAAEGRWEVKSYYRDSKKAKNKQSAISYVLFNKILGLGGLGIEYNFQDVLAKLKQFNLSDPEEKEIL